VKLVDLVIPKSLPVSVMVKVPIVAVENAVNVTAEEQLGLQLADVNVTPEGRFAAVKLTKPVGGAAIIVAVTVVEMLAA
jgi:hypothetical protein